MAGQTVQDSLRNWIVHRLTSSGVTHFEDVVAIEEPLEMRLEYGPQTAREQMALSITMRTPGHDTLLLTGFLITEGVVRNIAEIRTVLQLDDNVVFAFLEPESAFDPETLSRHFYTSSSCGVCGKTSLDLVRQAVPYRLRQGHPRVPLDRLTGSLASLNAGQPLFAHTGGNHATALFSTDGTLLCLMEDVGRHNAMDKMIGWAAGNLELPLTEHFVIVSGRASFELVQKALAAGLAVMGAVGAPSSLAAELAQGSGMTLAGFLRNDRVNVYTHPERVVQ